MNLFVLGATGGTGRHVLAQALEGGHRVTAFVRDPSRLPAHEHLTVLQGDLDKPDALRAAMGGHDAVVCTLGAPGRDRQRVRERGTRAAIDAMRASGVRRIVALSSYGVGESRVLLPWWIRFGLVPLLLGPGFADHEVQERLLRESGLDWTIARPPFLTDDEGGTRVVRAGDLQGTQMKIPRADVARELLQMITQADVVGRAVAIASA